jgi:hypothetical protein
MSLPNPWLRHDLPRLRLLAGIRELAAAPQGIAKQRDEIS